MSRSRATTGLALCATLAIACGPGARGSGPGPGEVQVEGRITFDARHPTPQGTSAEIARRPARFVDLEVLDAAGRPIAEGRTDEDGGFSVIAPDAAATLRVLARVRHRGHDVAVTTDPGGRDTHAMDVPIDEADEAMEVHAEDTAGHAGAFHVVDTLLLGLEAARSWTDRELPPLFVYWVRGGTREWSFYRGERPHGSGRYALELLGGDPGQASISDTDEHDEAIVLHELGHFVMDRLSGDSSTGGMHPRGARIDPGLAWEEGRATWFAIAVLGEPLYQDTIGVEPWGRLRVDENLETGEDPVAGIASETSVAKVLWDLSDGGDSGLPDADQDGVAIGPAAVLQAMIAQAQQPGAFPSLGSFLLFLTQNGVVERDALAAALQRTGEPPEILPPSLDDAWPPRLAPGASFRGRIDGVTQPAPSGGMNLPITGWDANHTFRVHVEQPGMLVARLYIDGSGRASDHEDLDVEILDLRADRLADARGEAPLETASHLVQPGDYIVRVRDGGGGNRAVYELQIALETL